jgi:hypothetical protein
MPYSDPEKGKQQKRMWYLKNKEEIARKANIGAAQNGGLIALRKKRWYHETHSERLAHNVEYRAKDPLRMAAAARKYKLKYMYGITEQEYAEREKSCGGKCEICGTVPKKLHIDHDKKTGKFRGLLCPTCNRGLGHFYDMEANFLSAASYLRRSNEVSP